MWAQLKSVMGWLGIGSAVVFAAHPGPFLRSMPAPASPPALTDTPAPHGVLPTGTYTFNPMSWQQLLQRDLLAFAHQGKDSSLTVRTERARLKAGKVQLLKGFRDLLPALTFDFEDSTGKLSGGRFTVNNYRLDFRQPLFHGGALWHEALAARAKVHAFTASYAQAVQDAQLDAMEAFLNYYAADASAAEFAKLHHQVAAWRDLGRQAFAGGVTSKIESLKTESSLTQLASEALARQGEVRVRAAKFRSALGLDIQADLPAAASGGVEPLVQALMQEAHVEPAIEAMLGTDRSFEDYAQLALAQRPELIASTEEWKAARHAEHAAHGDLLPQVDLIGSWGDRAESLVDVRKDPPHQPEWFAGLAFTWRFGGNTIQYTGEHHENAPSVTQFAATGGTRRITHHVSVGVLDALDKVVEAKEKTTEQLAAAKELDEVRRKVLQDVAEAYYGLEQARLQWEAAHEQLPLQRRLRALAEHRFTMHEIELSDLVQAELAYATDVEKLRAALVQTVLARWKLDRAIGTFTLDHEPVQKGGAP